MSDKRFSFSKKAIEKLIAKCAGKRHVAHDDKTPGLILEIREKGSCSFYLYRRLDGRPTKLRIGAFPEVTVENARNRAQEWNGEVAKGKNPAAERRAVRDTMTLAELWEYYLTTYAKPRKRSWKTDEWLYTKFLSPWASRRINQISRSDFERLHAKLGERSIVNANRTRSLLLTMYTKAAGAGYSGANPVFGTEPFTENARERYLTPDELKRLFEALAKESNQILADAVRFGVWTGARRGNWLSARWDEIDLKTQTWIVPGSKSKSGKPIVVHLCEEAIAILKRRSESEESTEWVFPSRYGDGPATTAKFAWKRVCKAAGIENCRIHDLRRTNASFAVSAGVPLLHVSKNLGHGSTEITESVYAHIHDPERRQAAIATAEAMAEAIKPKKQRKANKKGGDA